MKVPGTGYVGVGVVEDAVCPIDDFSVTDASGQSVPLTGLDVKAAELGKYFDDPETAEYLVRMTWLKTVPIAKAIKKRGFFGNQNSAASPLSPKWDYTAKRLKGTGASTEAAKGMPRVTARSARRPKRRRRPKSSRTRLGDQPGVKSSAV